MRVIHKDTDITDYIHSLSWGGSNSQVARKLEMQVVNAPLDANVTKLNMDLADPIFLYDDDGVTEIFRGYITEREASSVTGTVTYVAYDILFYTQKSNATYNFSGETAETITQMVCRDMEIPTGTLAATGLAQKLIVQNVSIYNIIQQAYDQAAEKNGKEYIIRARQGALCVDEVGDLACDIYLTEDSNITSSKYKETLNNMVNKVKIYDGEGNPSGTVQNDDDLRYGVFQQVYTKEEGKDATTTAKSMFKGVEKSFTLECLNYNGAVTGAGAIVVDRTTGLSGSVWIEADTHTWQNGVATMSLTLQLKDVMPVAERKPTPKAAAPVVTEKTPTESPFKVGDIVQFKGGNHYTSSDGTVPGGKPSAGSAKITKIEKNAPHPYHLVTENWDTSHVWGWVDAGTFD